MLDNLSNGQAKFVHGSPSYLSDLTLLLANFTARGSAREPLGLWRASPTAASRTLRLGQTLRLYCNSVLVMILASIVSTCMQDSLAVSVSVRRPGLLMRSIEQSSCKAKLPSQREISDVNDA